MLFLSVCLYVLLCLYFIYLFYCRKLDENFEVYPTPKGGAKSSHFLLVFQPFLPFFCSFFPFSAFCMASILHPQSLFHSFPLCPPRLSVSAFSPLSLCSSLSGGSVSNGISSADQPEASSQAKCRSCC